MRISLLFVVLVACTVPPPPPDTQQLAARLVAPCCWKQTLADHDSPLANELRREIRGRLAAGEAPAVIEGSLVERYGPRIQAVGATGQHDPRAWIGVGVAAAALAGIAALVYVLRRSRVAPEGFTRAAAREDERYVDRLEDELAASPD